MSNIQWLADATTYHSKEKDSGFYHEFCWLYVHMQYGHNEDGTIKKY